MSGVQNSDGVNFSDANYIVVPTDKNSHKAKAILEKIKDVSPISNKWLSENSIYHEFLLV